MKCEWVRENILLFVYNELPDDARYELETHVARCADCAIELKATRVFHATLSSRAVEEPTPNLLAASRMRLQEALEDAEQGGFWQKLTFDPWAWLRQMRFSPPPLRMPAIIEAWFCASEKMTQAGSSFCSVARVVSLAT